MDCERFEATLIDELYGELDELTSAATKRHAAGCARCATLLGGLRATRRVAVLPQVEPSADLEDRILAAAKDAQKVVPIGRKVSRAISWAGSWAMRPQTAMAAVFILMVGSSVLFVRRRKVADNATVTVTAQGAPAASAPAPAPSDESASLDSKVAAAAHGAGPVAPPYAPATAASATPSDGLGGIAKADSKGGSGGTSGQRGTEDQEPVVDRTRSEALNAQAPAGAPALARAAQMGSGGKGEVADSPAQGPLDQAKALYAAKDYVAATNAYDAIAATGDLEAALGAARSVRDGNGGCAVAKDRFDQIAARAWGTTAGYDATLEAGRCYRALGATDAAQARYAKLLTVQQFAPRAQAEINGMSQFAAVRASSKKPSKTSSIPAAPYPGQGVQQPPAAPEGSSSPQQRMAPSQKAAQ
jgi:hypothetical protein